MAYEVLDEKYFQWMCEKVSTDGCPDASQYQKLLNYLNSREFIYILDMDGNRYADGIDLRYRFGYESKIPSDRISVDLDTSSCSILEMMVALANRCEEQIMSNSDIGNRTGMWFWSMIANLGLEYMDDDHFDKRTAGRIISRFLNRKYGYYGEGGLFTVWDCKRDLREVEIWYQMMWYLNTIVV